MLHAAVLMANYHNFVYTKFIYGYHQAAYYFVKRAGNHISGSFVEMVLWWARGGMRQTPEELDRCFRAVIEPALQH